MTTARSSQICLKQTPWYHCTSRCVRRAFICGFDRLLKRDFSHRKQWIEDRILHLASAFCIDVAAYAIMSNHYHVVLKVDLDTADKLTHLQIVERWLLIYPNNQRALAFLSEENLPKEEQIETVRLIEKWRTQLVSISRFMGLINQYIARKSNKEDDCKGRFWEARFHSQAILDDSALIRTLAYVDLNPIRTKSSDKSERSKHTSINRRLSFDAKQISCGLLPFGKSRKAHSGARQTEIPFALDDYLNLLQWSTKALREPHSTKYSSAPSHLFQQLEYSEEQWLKSLKPKNPWKQVALGSIESISEFCKELDRKWIWQSQEHLIQ